jgi:hypothetical protein
LFIDDVVKDIICGDNTMFELPIVAAVAVAVAIVVVVERNGWNKKFLSKECRISYDL